jgi:hypothetical protein
MTFAAMAVAAILAIVVPPWMAQRRQTAAITEALRRSIAPRLPEDGIRVIDGAAIKLPSGQSDVRLYLVQSASGRSLTDDAAQNDMK